MKNPFKTMLQNIDSGDFEELRDVPVMMSEDMDKQDKKIKALEKKVKRVNDLYPSTVVDES